MRKLLPILIALLAFLVLTSCEFTVRHGDYVASWQRLSGSSTY